MRGKGGWNLTLGPYNFEYTRVILLYIHVIAGIWECSPVRILLLVEGVLHGAGPGLYLETGIRETGSYMYGLTGYPAFLEIMLPAY